MRLHRLARIGLLFALALLPLALADSFYIAPHLQNVSQDGVTIIWQTEESGPAEVEYGPEGHYDQKAANPANEMIRRVRITGLQPDTAYSYRIHAGETEYTNAFKTAPAKDPNREVTFVAIGDTRRWEDLVDKTKLWDHVLQWNPEFFINNGDLVGTGHKYDLWPEHFRRFSPINGKYMVTTARGNHEGSMLNDTENDWFGKYHEAPGGQEPYAFFDWGNTHVAILSWEQTMPNGIQEASRWLDSDLNQANSQYVFVVQHFPVYCTGYNSPKDDRKQSGNDMLPLRETLDKHHVDVDMAGHTHIYERHYPLRENQRNDREGVLYIVNGGDINGNCPDWWTAVSDYHAPVTKPTYTVVQCKIDRMIVRTFCWSQEKNEFVQFDYVVRWKDEAIPKGILESLPNQRGADLIGAMEDLAAMTYAPAAPALLPYLKDGEAAIRQEAAKAISLIGNADIAGDLLPYLNDEDPLVRRYAARALEVAMPEDLSKPVAVQAADPKQDEETRVKLIGALQFHAPAKLTHDIALDILQSEASEPVRQRASYAFTGVATAKDVKTLTKLFEKETSPYVTVRLAFTLNQVTGKVQNLDGRGEIANSVPGKREEIIKKWMNG